MYHCEDGQSYLMYPGVNRVLHHDRLTLAQKTEIVSLEKNVMDILGVSCDHMIVEHERFGHTKRVEYFMSSQHYLDDQVPLADDQLILEDSIQATIPFAIVEGSGSTYQAAEAIEIEAVHVPEVMFALPESSTVVSNGLVLDTRPEPRRGDSWWYGKLQASLRYPKSARKELATGRVTVMFTITQEGRMEDAEVVHEVDEVFKTQVLTFLAKSLVRWNPAKVDGKPVSSTLVLPISFNLFP